MAKVAVFNEERTVWVPYDKDTEILFTHIPLDEIEEIQARAERKTKLGARLSSVGNWALAKKCIKDWRLILDHSQPGLLWPEDGTPIEFNEANLRRLIAKSTRLCQWMNDTLLDDDLFLDDDFETKEADLSKD